MHAQLHHNTSPSSVMTVPIGRHRLSRPGFSVVELLVVIAIIAVLAGVLLVALNAARNRAMQTSTQSAMAGFQSAAETYYMEHNEYPGVIPDRLLADDPQITSTENALLALMGGYRVLSPSDAGTNVETEYENFVDAHSGPDTFHEYTFTDGDATWQLAVDTTLIGQGPYVRGKTYAPYFTPDDDMYYPVDGQTTDPGYGSDTPPSSEELLNRLPDFVDAFGQPITYVRQMRKRGALVGMPGDGPQFTSAGLDPYLLSEELGELQQGQTLDHPRGSMLNVHRDKALTLLLQHPTIPGASRGAFMLFSAGPDGIYYSRTDGPGTTDAPIDEALIDEMLDETPQLVEEFDDLRVFGGG